MMYVALACHHHILLLWLDIVGLCLSSLLFVSGVSFHFLFLHFCLVQYAV
jgi:hypothetical protein